MITKRSTGAAARRPTGAKEYSVAGSADYPLHLHLVQAIRQRLCERLYSLGARPLFEFLAELAREHGITAAIDRKLERYAALDRKILRALGGDRFPAVPIHRVRR